MRYAGRSLPAHAAYAAALERARLDGDTRRAYDSRVRTFLARLDTSGLDGDPLTDAHDRDSPTATSSSATTRPTRRPSGTARRTP